MKPLSEIKPGDLLLWWEGPGNPLYLRRVLSTCPVAGMIECDGDDGREHVGTYGADMWSSLYDMYAYWLDLYKEALAGLNNRADALYYDIARNIDKSVNAIDDVKRAALCRELEDIAYRIQALDYCVENELNNPRKELLKCDQNNQEIS